MFCIREKRKKGNAYLGKDLGAGVACSRVEVSLDAC